MSSSSFCSCYYGSENYFRTMLHAARPTLCCSGHTGRFLQPIVHTNRPAPQLIFTYKQRLRPNASNLPIVELAKAPLTQPFSPKLLAIFAGCVLLFLAVKKLLDTPSRKYDLENPNVGRSYDAWEREGLVEYYWGEHIHLGFYSEEERKKGYKKKNFKLAKFDFIDAMLKWSGSTSPRRVLDVGCGIGGTSRYLAKKFPQAQIEGITLSPNQVRRASELAEAQGISNVSFKVMDALNMKYQDDTFDLVWACESGEHMPDKRIYIEEMTRVLSPGVVLPVKDPIVQRKLSKY